MATHWIQPFTAADGSTWDDVGFTRVAGGAIDALVYGNRGQHGATAAQRFYLSSGYPPTRDYKLDCQVYFALPAVQGRSAGIAARLTSDGAVCYWCDLSSFKPSGGSIGTPHIRLFRRRASVNTTLVAETDISASVSAADLAAGVVLRLRIKNTADGEVNLKVQINKGAGYVTHADYTDTAGAGVTIEDGGGVGIVTDALSTADQVEYDNFSCLDFADESVDLEYQDGLALIINGVYYDEEQIEELGLTGIKARQSYAIRPDGEIADLSDFHDPVLRPGDDISILFDQEVLASGVIRPMVRSGHVAAEGVSYEIHGPKVLCQGVVVAHPTSGAGQITFNADADSPDYNAAYANKSPGAILQWLYDNHTEGQDGLRAHRACPAYDPPVTIPGALTAGPVLPNVTLSGDFAAAVEMVLSLMPGWAWRVDPETRVHYFDDRSASAKTDIDTADDHIELDIEVHPELNRTAVLIRGAQPEVEMTTLSLSAGTLSGNWDVAAENDWNATVARHSSATGDVASTSIPGDLKLDPDQTGGKFPMLPREWIGCVLTFTSGAENGNSYEITDNDTVALYLWGGAIAAWISGGPAVNDTFIVEDKQSDPPTPSLTSPAWEGVQYNNLYKAYREFIPDGASAGVELAEGKCYDIRLKVPIPGGQDDQFEVRHVGGRIENGKVVLDSSATLPTGLFNYLPGRTGDACDPGGAQGVGQDNQGDIEVDAPVRNTLVPRIRRPVAGFHGTAYSLDPTKWDGGGEAGYGDPGQRTMLVVDDPNFNSLAFAAEYQAYGDALLEVYGSLAVQARVEYTDKVVTAWAGLDAKVTLTDTEGDRLTGYETSDDLWLAEVEWDLTEWRTTLSIGNLVAYGGINIQAVRSRYAESNRIKQIRDAIRKHDDFLNCMKTDMRSAVAADITGSQGLCASAISAGGGGSVADSLPEFSVNSGEIGTPAVSGPCVDLCAPGLVVNKAQMLLNAADAISARPAIVVPDGSWTLPIAGAPPGQPQGAWIEDVVACLQSHVDGLWTTLHDQTTAAEAAFKAAEDCFDSHEDVDAALWAAVLTLYACHNAFVRQVIATFQVVMPGPFPGVALLPDPGGADHCEVPASVEAVCGPLCECAITAATVDCLP